MEQKILSQIRCIQGYLIALSNVINGLTFVLTCNLLRTNALANIWTIKAQSLLLPNITLLNMVVLVVEILRLKFSKTSTNALSKSKLKEDSKLERYFPPGLKSLVILGAMQIFNYMMQFPRLKAFREI